MQNKCITVLVATARRPHYLRKALTSIREQTALGEVAEVIVSENGGDRESADVVGEFSDLPIRYIYRDPPTSALEHGTFLCQQPLTELTAILHDDDWWMPEHLAHGLEALRSRNAVAYYAGFYQIWTDSGMMVGSPWHFPWCFGADFPKLEPVWEFSLGEMAAASFLATPGHYSSLVASSEALKTAARMIHAVRNPCDNDRLFIVALATQGTILYRPLAGLFVRYHALQDQRNFRLKAMTQHAKNTNDWIMETCRARGLDLPSIIAQRIMHCPAEGRLLLKDHLDAQYTGPQGHKLALRFPGIAPFVPDSWCANWQARARNILRLLLPPLLVQFMRLLRSTFLQKNR